MEKPPTNFYDWYKKYILSNNLQEQKCMGYYMVEGIETVLSFVAISVEIYKPWVVVLN